MFKKIKSFLFENKTDKQTIIKNTFWLMLAEGVSKGGMFLVTILIARILGPEQFGILSFVMSFVAMFIVITDFGLTTLMVREVSRNHSKIQDYLINLSFLKVILGIITFILVWIVSQFIGKPDFYITLILIYVGYAIINNLGEFIRAFFRPSEKMQYEALLKVINGVLMLIIVLGSLFLYGDLKSILYGYLIAGGLNLFISFVYVWNKFKIRKFKLSKNIIKNSLKSGIYLMGGILFIGILSNTDKIMLGFFNLEIDLGLYSAMNKLMSIILLIITIYINSTIPNLIKNYSLIKIKKIIFHILIITFIPLIISIFFGDTIISFIYGEDFLEGKVILIIFFITLILLGINSFYYYLLNSFGYEKTIFYFVIITGLLNVILNFILIPLYGGLGSVIATLICEILAFILLITFFIKNKYLIK